MAVSPSPAHVDSQGQYLDVTNVDLECVINVQTESEVSVHIPKSGGLIIE
jgi:hypothetical protein